MANCTVVDGVLSPCPTLGRSFGGHRRLGVSHLEVIKEQRISRSGAVLKSGDLPPNGVIMNFCPFCGSPIGDHFTPKEEPAK